MYRYTPKNNSTVVTVRVTGPIIHILLQSTFTGIKSKPQLSAVALCILHSTLAFTLGQSRQFQHVFNLLFGRDIAVCFSFLCSRMIVMLSAQLAARRCWIGGQLAGTVQRTLLGTGWVMVAQRHGTSLLCVAACVPLLVQNAYSQFPSLPFLFDF